MLTLWIIIILLLFIALGFILAPLLNTHNIAIKPDWTTAIILLILFTIFVIGFYWYNGSSNKLYEWQQQMRSAAAVQQLRTQLGSPQQVIAALQQHLKQNPDSARGWYLLG